MFEQITAMISLFFVHISNAVTVVRQTAQIFIHTNKQHQPIRIMLDDFLFSNLFYL